MCSICYRQFATPRFVVRGSLGWSHSMPRPWVPIGPHWHIRSISYRLWVTKLAPKEFSPVRPGYDDKYRTRTCRFVERQKWTTWILLSNIVHALKTHGAVIQKPWLGADWNIHSHDIAIFRRPEAPDDVLDLRSLVEVFGESCTIVHCITSQAANVS